VVGTCAVVGDKLGVAKWHTGCHELGNLLLRSRWLYKHSSSVDDELRVVVTALSNKGGAAKCCSGGEKRRTLANQWRKCVVRINGPKRTGAKRCVIDSGQFGLDRIKAGSVADQVTCTLALCFRLHRDEQSSDEKEKQTALSIHPSHDDE
jgi:hypothetical protein